MIIFQYIGVAAVALLVAGTLFGFAARLAKSVVLNWCGLVSDHPYGEIGECYSKSAKAEDLNALKRKVDWLEVKLFEMKMGIK